MQSVHYTKPGLYCIITYVRGQETQQRDLKKVEKGLDNLRHLCYNNSIKDERKYKNLKKIDRRKAYYVVLDTETCNSIEDNMVYDLGFAVVDKYGRVYEQFSFVLYEVYVGMKDVMQTAYYANKLPQYEIDLANGTRKMVSILTARKILRDICKEYRVRAIMAHNAEFDNRALKRTLRYITKSEYKWFLPYDIEIWDTMFMARDTIGKSALYPLWCKQNGFMTNQNPPRPQLKAETLYRYMTGNKNFVESHTGLEDVMIEKEIFRKCMSYHKPMRKKLFKD